MNIDSYKEVVNGQETYKEIANLLHDERQNVLIGWTDNHYTHFDILFSTRGMAFGANIQRGVKPTDLFVSIMGMGAFGFKIKDEDLHASYVGEKLNIPGDNPTTKGLAELISGVRREIINCG